jgi:hypothetical protein
MAVYNGTAWQKSITGIPFTATGGTITTSGSYTIHTFTSSGTFTPAIAGTVDYLVVAGGGGGGFEVGGAGGAGGFRTAAGFSVAATGLTVTVGAGGTGRTSDGVPPTGADSVFSSITSLGGGGAGSAVNPAPANNINGGNGGSGGSGAGRTGATAGTGTAGQGNNAGATVGNYNWSLVAEGGGGGADDIALYNQTVNQKFQYIITTRPLESTVALLNNNIYCRTEPQNTVSIQYHIDIDNQLMNQSVNYTISPIIK